MREKSLKIGRVMSRLPLISGRELVEALEKIGFSFKRRKGEKNSFLSWQAKLLYIQLVYMNYQ